MIARLLLMGALSSILTITTLTAFAEGPYAPHFKININDQLTQDVSVEVLPTRYQDKLWNGKCSDTVYHSSSKAICAEGELANGIPSMVVPQINNENQEAEVMNQSNSPHSEFGGTPYYYMPFEGNIVIRNKAGSLLATIAYTLKAHRATFLGKLNRFNSNDRGVYMQWDKLDVLFHDPDVTVNVLENYPSLHNWCYMEDNYYNYDITQIPCSSSPVITLSIKQ